jgi:hypothetical protein
MVLGESENPVWEKIFTIFAVPPKLFIEETLKKLFLVSCIGTASCQLLIVDF